jgi:hypothetical protein
MRASTATRLHRQAGSLLLTLMTILILFFGVFLSRTN